MFLWACYHSVTPAQLFGLIQKFTNPDQIEPTVKLWLVIGLSDCNTRSRWESVQNEQSWKSSWTHCFLFYSVIKIVPSPWKISNKQIHHMFLSSFLEWPCKMNSTERKIKNLDKFLFLDLFTETDTVSSAFKFSHWASVMFFLSEKPIYLLISAACLEHQSIISAWNNSVSSQWAHWQLDTFQVLCFTIKAHYGNSADYYFLVFFKYFC